MTRWLAVPKHFIAEVTGSMDSDLKRAAIGLRVHSGWGALVVVSGKPGQEEVVDRRRVTVIDEKVPGSAQPFHFVEEMKLDEAEKRIAEFAARSGELARAAIHEVVQNLQARGHKNVRAAGLVKQPIPVLPPLAKILKSHPLLHTAEGEFFRRIFREAFEHLHIPFTGVPERELNEHFEATFGKAAPDLRKRIDGMGRTLGPPWTADQKTAALAACIVLKKS